MAKKDTENTENELPQEEAEVLDVVEGNIEELEETEKLDQEHAEPALEDEFDDDHEVEPADDHEALSARILRWLVIFIVGAAAALWAGPKIAPVLPAGLKPVSEFLSPQTGISSKIDTVKAEFDVRIAELESSNLQQDTVDQFKSLLDQFAAKNTELESGNTALSTRLDALETTISALQTEIAEISARQVLSVEGGSASEETIAQFEEKLAAIITAQQELDQSQAQASEAQQDAAGKLRLAKATNALSQITEALETGRTFTGPLDQLSQIEGLSIPAVLADIAPTGAPSLFDLKKELPKLARIVLREDAATKTDGSVVDKFTSFLKSQVGTRSLEPQEGETIDAVLSRIESALDVNDLGKAMTEAGSLSDLAKTTMGDWIASLAILNNATAAVNELQQHITTAQR